MTNSNDNDDDESLFDEESDSSTRGTPETKRRRMLIPEASETNQDETAEESNHHNNTTTTASSNNTEKESLHSLISKKQWDGVLERVQQLRAPYQKEEQIPELHETEQTLHMTPLYSALTPEHVAPLPVIDALLDSYTIQDTHAFLPNPLLSACAISHSQLVIQRILQYQPSLILERDEMNMNVLHVILQQQPTLDLVQLLVTSWARESSSNSSTSLEDAWTQLLSAYDGHGVLPIHYAIEHHADTSVILLLLEKFPSSADMCLQQRPDDDDDDSDDDDSDDDDDDDRNSTRKATINTDISTVHHAVFHGCSYPVLKALLQHYGPLKLGDAGTIRNKKDTPLHLLFHPDVQHVWQTTSTTTTDDDCMSRYKMAWYLIQQFSTTLKQDFGVKKGNKAEQAHKLVFSIKGASGQTVYQMATALAKQFPNWEQLALLLRDFHQTIFQHSREWPLLDYTSNEQE